MVAFINDFSLKTVGLDAPQKEYVRILVGQPHWTPNEWTRQAALLYTVISEEKPRLWLEAFLQKAKQVHCDLVLLPELSVPESLVRLITAWSNQTGTMVIGGSHYHEREEGTVARSPITYAGQVYYVEKIHQAPAEVAPIQGKGLQPGKDLCVFANSPVGKLGVLICSDYLRDPVKNLVLNKGLDVLCILAFQNDSSRYHKRIDIDVDNTSSGIYVLYANNVLEQFGDGRSAAFAVADKLFRDQLLSEGHTDTSCDSMLCQLRADEDFFVVDLDLKHRRPSQRRNVDARPNLIIVERGTCFSAAETTGSIAALPAGRVTIEATPFFSQHPHQELCTAIIDRVRRLIANHGLDDPEWTKAFSSMYFLVSLGRLLGLSAQEDYQNLLDQFLKFFNFRANDTLYLREDQVLVTPNENERIRECMEAEDAHDPYFTLSAKTRANSVNAHLMHENYLYGVALGISAQENTKIMQAVRDAALAHLVYRTNPSARDAHGGWSPYRVPWITARILISFSYVDLTHRVDEQYMLSVVDQGLTSLIDRLHPEGYWRSGVGNWVSKWEGTALCLEAFLEADRSRRFSSVINEVVTKMFSGSPDWSSKRPDFASEELSNETLAATLMSSVILRLVSASPNPSVLLPPATEDALYKYLLDVLDEISHTTRREPRQFCTIPQIAAYSAAAVLGQQYVVR